MSPDIQRVIGFDFGMKRIGMAVGQTISGHASPLSYLKAKDGVPNWIQLKQVIDEWQPDALVLGIPLTTSGQFQHTTYAAKKFAKKLSNQYGLPVFEEDERLTTVEARQQLFEQGGFQTLSQTNVDSIAAVLILEQWLQSRA